MSTTELRARIVRLEGELAEAQRLFAEAHQAELLVKPLPERMVYSATSRCPCGLGLAYDPAQEDENSVFKGALSGFWDCSGIILGTADRALKHTDRLPFSFWEIKSEGQPSANGMTTRPK